MREGGPSLKSLSRSLGAHSSPPPPGPGHCPVSSPPPPRRPSGRPSPHARGKMPRTRQGSQGRALRVASPQKPLILEQLELHVVRESQAATAARREWGSAWAQPLQVPT